jgi:hypothetical protein
MNQRRLRSIVLIMVIALVAALTPSIALAQEISSADEGFLLRVNGSVVIASQEIVDNVIVIGGDATVEGTITGTLVVVGGDAIVTGTVMEDITVVIGTLDLGTDARVNDVSIIRGDLVRDPGAVVGGTITQGDYQVNFWDWGVFWAFMWAGMTLVVVTAGVLFAAVGGRQLKQIGSTIGRAPGPTILGVIVAWIVLPMLMVPVMLTIVGIPLSFGYFMFVLPVFWFLGYIVAGTQLGRAIWRTRADDANPYLPAMLGLVILQLITIIPVLGGLIAFLAGVAGSGALLVVAWRAWQGKADTEAPADVPAVTLKPVH